MPSDVQAFEEMKVEGGKPAVSQRPASLRPRERPLTHGCARKPTGNNRHCLERASVRFPRILAVHVPPWDAQTAARPT